MTDRKQHMAPISTIISPFAKKVLGKRGFMEIDIISNWEDIIGKQFAEFTSPLRIDFPKGKTNEGTLHIETLSGAFALELQHKEKLIIEKVNTYFGYKAISHIKTSQNPNFNTKPEHKEQKTLVTKEDENYISEIVGDLHDSKLKEILTKLGTDILSSNNKKETK